MAIYLQALAAVAGVYILSSIYNLYKNLQWAKKHNIPYLISPYSQSTIIAGFISGAYCKVASKLGLKGRWVDWARMGSFNAPWKYKRALYAEYGDIIFDVSPGKAVLRIGDADVAWEMMQRRQDFPKPTESYERLNLYGDNVLGTEGREWRIHRKITSPPFSERNNKYGAGLFLYVCLQSMLICFVQGCMGGIHQTSRRMHQGMDASQPGPSTLRFRKAHPSQRKPPRRVHACQPLCHFLRRVRYAP